MPSLPYTDTHSFVMNLATERLAKYNTSFGIHVCGR